jgi:hypothetical protein
VFKHEGRNTDQRSNCEFSCFASHRFQRCGCNQSLRQNALRCKSAHILYKHKNTHDIPRSLSHTQHVRIHTRTHKHTCTRIHREMPTYTTTHTRARYTHITHTPHGTHIYTHKQRCHTYIHTHYTHSLHTGHALHGCPCLRWHARARVCAWCVFVAIHTHTHTHTHTQTRARVTYTPHTHIHTQTTLPHIHPHTLHTHSLHT